MIDDPFDLMTFDGCFLHSVSFEPRDSNGRMQISPSLEGSRLNLQVESAKRKQGLGLIPRSRVPSVETVHVNGLVLNMVDAFEISQSTAAD